RAALLRDRGVVQARAASTDKPTRFAVRAREPRADEELDGRHAAPELALGHAQGGECAAGAAFAEDPARGLLRGLRGGATVAERRRLGREHLLRMVDLAVAQLLEPRDLIERQIREKPQEAADVLVLGVAPELPVVIGAEPVVGEPDRTLRGLAHLGAG